MFDDQVAGAVAGLSYAEAVAKVLADPAVRYKLRQRIREDEQRDPVDCLKDAELLAALQRLRADEALRGA